MTNTPKPSLLSSKSRGIEVTQLCPTLCDPMDCSLQGYSVHWIFQTRVLEWVAISFSRGSSQPRDQTQVSCIAGRQTLYHLGHQGSPGGQEGRNDQFSRSVVSNSWQPHESQHARPPCPSPTPGVYSNSCPSSQWYHPAIPSSVIPFSSCPQSLPSWGLFPMSQLFAWGGQSIGVSASASVLPMNTLDWAPLG